MMTLEKINNIEGVMIATSIFYRIAYDDPRFASLVLAVSDKEDEFTEDEVCDVLKLRLARMVLQEKLAA
jgi:hypothetical protein